jgi:hypothetical protein
MGLDLYVWHEAEPISADAARAKLDRWADGDTAVFAHRGEVTRFRDALLQRYPAREDLPDPRRGVWSVTPARSDQVVVASCGWLSAAEVSAAVIDLATEHGLVCYEPGSRILHPNAPGYVAEFVLTGAGVPTIPDPDAKRLDWAVRRLNDKNYFAILDRADGGYAQIGYGSAAGVPAGTWALEYWEDGSSFRTETRDVAEAVGFVQEYLAGEDPWKRRHRWLLRNLDEHQPTGAIELMSWPDPAPALPLTLMRTTPEREALLRKRMPEPGRSAFQTGVDVLHWVHTSSHDSGEDAASALTRALNAVGIPARGVGVRAAGFGTTHHITEAWIDDLGRWVVLDGQNGALWTDGELEGALGAAELHRRFLAGDPPPRLAGLVKEYDAAATVQWWSYFHGIDTTGIMISAGSFVPSHEVGYAYQAERLTARVEWAYPDLGQVAIGVGGSATEPHITLSSAHPYAQGFAVECDGTRTDVALDDPRWLIDRTPGEHTASIRLVTPYGEHPAGTVTYVAR